MSSPKRNWFIGLGVTFLLIGTALLFFTGSHKGVVDKLKAELRARGEKLTYDELVPAPQTNPEQEREFATAATALGSTRIHPGNWDFLNFAAPGKVVLSWKKETLPNDYVDDSSTNNWHDFVAEAQKVSGETATLREILKTPAPDFSGNHSDIFNWARPPFVLKRTVAQWFMGETFLSLHEGKLTSAIENIETILGDARLYDNEPTLVSQMIAVAINGLALNATWHALQADGWNDAALVRLQNDWGKVSFPHLLEKGFEGERMFHFSSYETIKTQGIGKILSSPTSSPSPLDIAGKFLQDNFLFPLWKAAYLESDFLFGQQLTENNIIRFRRVQAGEAWTLLIKSREAEMVAFENEIGSGFGRIKHLLSAVAIPNFSKAGQTTMRNEAFRQLAMTAIAIKRFQLRHEKLPPNLEALVPDFLEKIPSDCMDAKPLRYQLHPDGTFTLYSVGDNGTDEGGDSTPPPAKVGKTPMPDMFNGPDIVWPQSVEPAEALKQ